jgi:hypothetical protein
MPKGKRQKLANAAARNERGIAQRNTYRKQGRYLHTWHVGAHVRTQVIRCQNSAVKRNISEIPPISSQWLPTGKAVGKATTPWVKTRAGSTGLNPI